MPDRLIPDDPTIPPPGKRQGAGSESLLPFLKRHLASRPKQPPRQDYRDTAPETSAGELEPSPREEGGPPSTG